MMGIPNWDNAERVDRFGEYVEIVANMLANEETTFEGRYYRVERATVHRSVQSPRPPITIAAMGPRMMRHAATHADTWNTMSFATEFEEQLAESMDRMSRMAGYCEAVGRDPETLRHSYLMFDTSARESLGHIQYYESPQAFTGHGRSAARPRFHRARSLLPAASVSATRLRDDRQRRDPRASRVAPALGVDQT